MDYETKRPLMEQIDKCPLEHAAALGTKDGGPSIADVYGMQEMAELHYYLKVQHEFTPDEVTSLLQFTDPLAVAVECWEERDPAKGFPICDLLNEIKAHERFPLVDPATDVIQALNDLLDKNMSDFDASLEGLDEKEIALIDEVTSTREVYTFIRHDQEFDRREAELLLRMEDPLKFIVDNWPCYDLAELARSALESGVVAEAGKEALSHPSHDARDTVSAEKPSILKQIKASRQESQQQVAPKGRSKGDEAR